MNVSPESELARSLAEGEGEAVTIAFANLDATICGIARVGRALSGGVLRTSGLGLLFVDGEPVAVRAGSGSPDDEADVWAGAAVAGVETEVLAPLSEWSVMFSAEDSAHGFDLSLSALSEPVATPADSRVGKLGGMAGYEQLVSVTGTVTVAGTDRRFGGLGQRGHSWGSPDWGKLSSARTIGVWCTGGVGVTATALRPERKGIEAEVVSAFWLEGDNAPARPVAEPLLSTIYDAEGRQRSAGLELWLDTDDDAEAIRFAGEVACGTTLDLGDLQLDSAFFKWSDGERVGVGRYDLLARR